MASSSKRLPETDDEESDCEEVIDWRGKKKAKTTQVIAHRQYRQKYTERFPDLKASANGKGFVFCETCWDDISIEHGGFNDCMHHVKTQKHQANSDTKKATPQITSFFQRKLNPGPSGPSKDDVTRAEAIIVGLVAELNLPVTAATKPTQAVGKMFPDSEIAKSFACSRGKATSFVKEIARTQKEKLRHCMKKGPFTISTEGSNDVKSKQFPLVRRFDPDSGEVRLEHLKTGIFKDFKVCLLSSLIRFTSVGKSIGAVAGWTWWRPPEGELTHASSATKQVLSSAGGLVGGVLHILDQDKRH